MVRLQLCSRPYYAVPAAGSNARFKRRHQRVIDSVFARISSSQKEKN